MQICATKIIAGAVGIVAMLPITPAGAQDYPSRPIQLIVPAAAGNSPDVVSAWLPTVSRRCGSSRWW